MKAYFSGTDTNTLFEAVTEFKFPLFLSIITNNALEIVAKIAVLSQQESQILSYVVENNKYIIKPINTKSEVIHTFDCDVRIENNSRYEKDITLTDKYFNEKKKVSFEKKSYSNNPNLNGRDKYNLNGVINNFNKVVGNKNLRPLTDFISFDKEDPKQLNMFGEEVEDFTNSTLQDRVNEYVISCILTDFAGEEYHLHTLQSALEDAHHTWNENVEEYTQELVDCLPDIFDSSFKQSDIVSITSVTNLEKELVKFIEENKILHKEEYLFITKAVLLNSKNFINGIRKELLKEFNKF